jgi:hypothetical protein
MEKKFHIGMISAEATKISAITCAIKYFIVGLLWLQGREILWFVEEVEG